MDLSCVHCIDDLCADDNGVWTHAGKPRRKYRIRHDPETCGLIYADPVEKQTPKSEIFTLVRIYHHHKEFRMFLIIMGKRCSMRFAISVRWWK